MAKTLKTRHALLAGVAAYSMLFTPAFAQVATEEAEPVDAVDTIPEAADEEASGRQDKITITGSLLRKDEFTSSSPIQVINAELATLEGLVDTAEILQSSSVAAGSVQLNDQFNGFVTQGGTGINSVSLRGLGAQRSLVLLNSRRPGPAGTRGQVGSFDLNVIPFSAIQRVDILKDGASSTYGSDAVAGVVNLITRTSVEAPELTVEYMQPMQSGGERLSVNGAFGLNFDTGNIMVAGQYNVNEDLSIGDRSYLACPEDRVTDANGNIIDREDRGIYGGTSASCTGGNLYHNTIIDGLFGGRYIPSPDGVTIGPLDGYRPRTNQGYGSGQAYFEDVINAPFVENTDALYKQELMSVFATADFDLPMGIQWNAEVLGSRRETTVEGWRQFFPWIATATYGGFGYGYIDPLTGAPDPFDNVFTSLVRPVYPYVSNADIQVDYYSAATGLDGDLSFIPVDFFKDWAWSTDLVYSKSKGTYGGTEILISKSGDWSYNVPCDTVDNPECYGVSSAPTYDPFAVGYLNGSDVSGLIGAIGSYEEGETEYEQTTWTSIITGPLFSLPAGEVGLALGTEWRTFSIDDQPSVNTQEGNLWGKTSAGRTMGEDDVVEFFGELEIPLLAGVPAFEELTVNGSYRTFNYASYGVDDVYKVGLNWQVVPALRFRATQGTSYRAPALYELFLANQTSFVGQSSIDPCILWDDPGNTNQNIRTNCAADGIPGDYNGLGSSATVYTGGGKDILKAETSESKTVGAIFTPSFIDLSIAVDYFEISVEDQVSTLSAGSILSACYGADNFPNAFCDLFTRNAPDDALAPNQITRVNASYVNIDSQVTRGFDITARYQHDFDFGDLVIDLQATKTVEDKYRLFSVDSESGFDTDDFNGTIGDPDWNGNGSVQFRTGDVTVSWFFDYLGPTSNAAYTDPVQAYQGVTGYYDVDTEAYWLHDVSVRYVKDTWEFTGGISNIFDEEPPAVSDGVTPLIGNVPIYGGYDLRGQSLFARVRKTF